MQNCAPVNQCDGMAAHSRVHYENYTVRNGRKLPAVLLPTSVYQCSIVWTFVKGVRPLAHIQIFQDDIQTVLKHISQKKDIEKAAPLSSQEVHVLGNHRHQTSLLKVTRRALTLWKQ